MCIVPALGFGAMGLSTAYGELRSDEENLAVLKLVRYYLAKLGIS